jgi:D-alanine transaminase
MMPDIGFVNGRFMPLAEAVVSVEDRGFQFGDGVYEVIRTYGGRPFQLDAHLVRLERSAKAIDLPCPLSHAQWTERVTEGIRLAGYRECKVYIQLTRGPAPRDHLFPTGVSPTAVMTVRELHPLSDSLRSGVDTITLQDFRWGRCDVKSVSLLANVLARQLAKDAGAFEAIFIRNGEVTEGAVSNVMIVRRGVLMTAPEGERILSGVTRGLVLELARKEGLTVHERPVSEAELRGADEVFLTGTTVEVLPVNRIDGIAVGSGRPGPVANLLRERFRDLTA